ncbi:MAG: PEP-CTERM sorting domain-containing protein, partial [Phycisphaerae bacterium]|nr:PEP-CTERM sorting domain-containing protein [Phycisphaerae bacterium]
TGLDETWTVGDLSLTDDEDGLIYLTGLSGGTLIGAVPGDANGDQIVDAADLTLFDVQWGVRGAGLSCDFDNDGDVDADDFAIMRGNWNFGVGGAPLPGIPTPEPATMSLLAIGGLLVLRRRRRER